jgi:hypothetical protein
VLRTHTPKLAVTCTDAAGSPRDSGFTVQWLVLPRKPIQRAAGAG